MLLNLHSKGEPGPAKNLEYLKLSIDNLLWIGYHQCTLRGNHVRNEINPKICGPYSLLCSLSIIMMLSDQIIQLKMNQRNGAT